MHNVFRMLAMKLTNKYIDVKHFDTPWRSCAANSVIFSAHVPSATCGLFVVTFEQKQVKSCV